MPHIAYALKWKKCGEIPSLFVSGVCGRVWSDDHGRFLPSAAIKKALQERGQNENPEQLPILPLWDIYYLIRSVFICLFKHPTAVGEQGNCAGVVRHSEELDIARSLGLPQWTVGLFSSAHARRNPPSPRQPGLTWGLIVKLFLPIQLAGALSQFLMFYCSVLFLVIIPRRRIHYLNSGQGCEIHLSWQICVSHKENYQDNCRLCLDYLFFRPNWTANVVF